MTLKRFFYIQYQIIRFMFGRNKLYRGKVTKDALKIGKELFQWLFREHDLNTMYYAYGLNEKGTNQSEYVGRREILAIRKKMEMVLRKHYGSSDLAYDIFTKDKFVANSFFIANHLSCIPHWGVIGHGYFIDNENSLKPVIDIFKNNDNVILKNLTLEASEGILYCQKSNSHINVNGKDVTTEEFKRKVQPFIWLVQPIISSHEQIRKFNSSALNTTRIVTIMDGNEPVYLTGFQAFATNNANTDSWEKGSIYVGINIEKGCLKKYGFYNLSVKDKSLATEHPGSKIVFENYPIPYLKEAIELCLKAHRLLFFNFLLGWDIAITDEGPVIVEANEKPGMNVVQCLDGGLRKRIFEYEKNTMEYLNQRK
jgi:hypothetical protein